MLPAGRRQARTDDGISLVELILAVALLGTAAVTLLGAFGTLIKTSDASRKSGDLTTTVAAAAEFVVDNSLTGYLDCATPAAYTGELATFPKPATITNVEVTTVRFWDGNANGGVGAFGTDCHDDVDFWRLQLITLALTTNSGETRDITVVKRG